jgi:hypothetical protein
MSSSCHCCVLSGRGLCVGLITHPEESSRVWCVWVWWRSPDNEEARSYCTAGDKKACQEVREGQYRCASTLFNLGARWRWVVSATPGPLRFLEWAGSHCVGGWVGAPPSVWLGADNSSLPVFDPRTVQPAASRCTDYAVPALCWAVCNSVIIRPSSSIRSFINSVLCPATFLVDGSCSIALNCLTLLSTLGSSPSSLFILGWLMV